MPSTIENKSLCSWQPPGKSKRSTIRPNDFVRFPGGRAHGLGGTFCVLQIQKINNRSSFRIVLHVLRHEERYGGVTSNCYSVMVQGAPYRRKGVKVRCYRVRRALNHAR